MGGSIKILVGYYKPSALVKNDIFIPIHCGRAVCRNKSKDGILSDDDIKWLLENMIGDDTGENISERNREICEMSAIYWAWKNYDKLGNPDYIGYNHYRRFFAFDENLQCDMGGDEVQISRPFLDKSIAKKNHKNIRKFAKEYDAIVSKSIDFRGYERFKTHRDAFVAVHDAEYFDIMVSSIHEKHPEYINALDILVNKKHFSLCNMFITSRDIFFNYAEWIFDILFDILKYKERSDLPHKIRAPSYLAEMLTSIYFYHLGTTGAHIGTQPIIYIENSLMVDSALTMLPRWLVNIICGFIPKRENRRHFRERHTKK